MSGRHRRSETSWDKKEDTDLHSDVGRGSSPNWSNAEANDGMPPGNFSGRTSWDPLQENRNRPKDDDISRDRHRMQTDPSYDEWGKQYSNRPSDDSYGLPYRGRDSPVGGSARMSRDLARERTRCPNRSRSRGRDWESTRRRSRSPFYDDRHESKSRRPDYSGGSRYGDDRNSLDRWRDGKGSQGYKKETRHDYHRRDDRNPYNDQDRRRESNQNSKTIPCKFFLAGNCNRDDCKFSHDAPESRGHDGRSHDNKNMTWHERHPHDDDDDDINTSNFGEKKKSWNGPWDVESGGFNEKSHDNIHGHASDDKKKLWDGGPSWHDDDVHASGFSNISKKSWNGSSRGNSGNNIEGKSTKKWNGPLWDDVSETGYSDIRKSSVGDGNASVILQTDDKIRKWDGPRLKEKDSEKIDYILPPWTSVNKGTGIQQHTVDGQVQHVVNDSDLNNANKVPEDAYQQILTSEKDSIQSVHDMNSQPRPYQIETEQNQHNFLSNPLNEPKIQSRRLVQDTFVHMESHNQTENHNKEGSKPLNHSDIDLNQTSVTVSLPEMPQKEQLPQLYSDLKLAKAIDFLKSLPNSAKTGVPIGNLSGSIRQENQIGEIGKSPKTEGNDNTVPENGKQEQKNINPEGKVEEGNSGNDEKAMKQFKITLVEFVKEILKPKWKEGKLSREVHKTVVKKVVDKVTSTIQGVQMPTTQPRIDQYLTYSKPKITKLVEAYVERLLKA